MKIYLRFLKKSHTGFVFFTVGARLVLAIMAVFCAQVAIAKPAPLIPLPSVQGEKLVFSSAYKANLFNLLDYFVTEKGLTYCGPASVVMELNAIGAPRPLTPSHAPYKIFNQNNIFYSRKILKIATPSQVGFHGMGLPQVYAMLINLRVHAQMYRADKVTLPAFRKLLLKTLSNSHYGIIANFSRAKIGEKHGMHFSPLAAYDKKSDRVLILDVARYKYPPQWVKAEDLWRAMRTRDTQSKQYRGFIVVWN